MENIIISNIIKTLNTSVILNEIDRLLEEELKSNENCDNLYNCFDLQAKLINLQIFLGKYLINLNNFSFTSLYENYEDVIVEQINSFYKPKNKHEFFNIACTNYLTNGFMFHGTSHKHYKNIIKNGLNGKHNFKNVKILNKVNDIFSYYNMPKCFEGKISVLNKNVFYASDNAYSAVYYAYQAPEFLSRFCANGHITHGNKYDTFAYFRRDKVECLNNIKTVCDSNNFTKSEEKITLKCFNLLWKQNVSKNEKFYLCLIPRQIVNRTDDEIKEKLNINKLSEKEIILELLNARHIHNKFYTPIESKQLFFIPLLAVNKKFKSISKGVKYITINQKKYFYDLAIDVPRKQKIYFCFNETNTQKHSNIFMYSQKDYDNFFKENLLLIANECFANSVLGEKIIDEARNLINLEQAKSIYLKRAKKDLIECNKLVEGDIKMLYNKMSNMYSNYLILFYAMITNNTWYSNLNSGIYASSNKILDPHYNFSHEFESKTYSKDIALDRLEKINTFIKSIRLSENKILKVN